MTFVDPNRSVFSFGVNVAALFGLLFVVRWNRDSDRTEMRAVCKRGKDNTIFASRVGLHQEKPAQAKL